MSAGDRPARSGARGLVLGTGALAAGAVGFAVLSRPFDDWVAKRLSVPRFEAGYGFRGGDVTVGPEKESAYGIVTVSPGGRFDLAGIRSGEIVDVRDLRRALSDSEQGQTGRLRVLSAVDWPNWGAARTVELAPWSSG